MDLLTNQPGKFGRIVHHPDGTMDPMLVLCLIYIQQFPVSHQKRVLESLVNLIQKENIFSCNTND